MKPILIFFRFVKFFFQAKTIFRIHSPFVFEFTKNVLEDKRIFYAFSGIERLRQLVLQNNERIEVTDFGAGSQVIKSKKRKISNMAQSSLTPAVDGQFFFRLINYYKPQTILELGTSFGISTLYQAMPNSKAKVLTIEGDAQIARIAQQHFKMMKVDNINLLNGPFDEQLPLALQQIKQLDYVFIDGNHRKEPTLKYFHQCLKKAHNNSIFIFHDIHWTTEMEETWETIKQHPKVKLSIDLFFMGIIFFKEEIRTKEDYKLIKKSWKPWVMGFFKAFWPFFLTCCY